MTMTQDVFERCCIDPEFRARLEADPTLVLREIGYDVAADVVIVLHKDAAGMADLEDMPHTVHLLLPDDPWLDVPSEYDVERTITPPGMSVCSKSHSCCCGFGDPIEESDLPVAA